MTQIILAQGKASFDHPACLLESKTAETKTPVVERKSSATSRPCNRPTLFEHLHMRFLVMVSALRLSESSSVHVNCRQDAPADTNHYAYIELLKKKNVQTLVRVCEPSYSTQPFKDAGITVIVSALLSCCEELLWSLPCHASRRTGSALRGWISATGLSAAEVVSIIARSCPSLSF
jgi:hypothetical protein